MSDPSDKLPRRYQARVALDYREDRGPGASVFKSHMRDDLYRQLAGALSRDAMVREEHEGGRMVTYTLDVWVGTQQQILALVERRADAIHLGMPVKMELLF